MVEELSQAQYDTVYNMQSLVIAAQLFTALFLLLNLRKVLPKYRGALVISATVCGVAAYHYFRIVDSFREAYVTEAVGGAGTYVLAEGASFNVAYRYVDWLITVPLLLLEAVVVLALVELGRVLAGSPREVSVTVRNLRPLLIGTWGVYPIAYLFPVLGLDGSNAFVAREIGYSVADILAKALFALVIFRIARLKSAYDDPDYALENDPTTVMLIEEVDGVRPTGVAHPETARTGEKERLVGRQATGTP